MTDLFSWSDIVRALRKLTEISPQFINQSLVVGGGSALCYNALLESAHHSRFKPVTPKAGQTNYSKDLDFANVIYSDWEKEFSEFLVADQTTGKQFVKIEGVRISFLQFGCTFDSEKELRIAKKFMIKETPIKINVLDPISLFREKTYLIEKGRGKINDHFHQEIAKTYVLFDYEESLKKPEKKDRLFQRVKEKAPELLPELRSLSLE
jgi:hypothetical protein